jgi:hypothetical protein
MRIFKLLILILIVCILGLLVKITEYRGDGVSTRQDIELSNYHRRSTNAPEFALAVRLLSDQSLTELTGEK